MSTRQQDMARWLDQLPRRLHQRPRQLVRLWGGRPGGESCQGSPPEEEEEEEVRVDGRTFYDVKNAKLMDRRKDETVVQREPQVDMDKFTAFCEIANAVVKPDSDFVWILAGKSECQRGSDSQKGGRVRMERQSGPYRL